MSPDPLFANFATPKEIAMMQWQGVATARAKLLLAAIRAESG